MQKSESQMKNSSFYEKDKNIGQSSSQNKLTSSSFKVLFQNNNEFKIPMKLEKSRFFLLNFQIFNSKKIKNLIFLKKNYFLKILNFYKIEKKLKICCFKPKFDFSLKIYH